MKWYRENENIVGLKKGKTPEEVERFAIEDAKANANKLGIDLTNNQIYSQYTNGRVMERPQERG